MKHPMITVQSVDIENLRLRNAFAGCVALETGCQLRENGVVSLAVEPHDAPFFGSLHMGYHVEDLKTGRSFNVEDKGVWLRWYPTHESFTRRAARFLKRDGFVLMDYDRGVIEWLYLTKGIPAEEIELLKFATFVRPHLLAIIAHDPELRTHDFVITDAFVKIKPAPSFFNRSLLG